MGSKTFIMAPPLHSAQVHGSKTHRGQSYADASELLLLSTTLSLVRVNSDNMILPCLKVLKRLGRDHDGRRQMRQRSTGRGQAGEKAAPYPISAEGHTQPNTTTE